MATFSVNAVTRKVQATGNGTAGPVAFSFQVNATSDVAVYVDTTLKTLTTHYIVTLATDGTGSVSFTSGNYPTSSQTITLIGKLPTSRTSVYTSGGNITATSLESDFDTNIMLHAQTDEKLTRTLTAPISDPSSLDFTLPTKASRLGAVLGFNATTGAPEAGPTITAVQSLADVTTAINLLGTSDAVSDMNTLGTSSNVTNMNTLAGISSNLTTVAGIASNVTTVAGVASLITSDFVSDLNLVATSSVIEDLNLLGTSGVIEDLNLLGTSAIVEDLNLLATSSVIADMATLAGSGASPNITSVTASGAITAGSFVIGSADINENDLEAIDNVTAGTVAQSKAVVVDTNKDISSFRNVTLTGELDAGSLDVSGDANIAGEVQTTKIAFTDGDDAMTITDTGLVEFNTGFNVGSDASGDILYNNGSKYVRLAKGTDGEFLSLASGVPAWASVSAIPSGIISMWSGSSGSIPSGWVICDGNNSTPNLTDKFIKASGTAGTTGGSATSGATTLDIAKMPAHVHSKNYTPGTAAAYVAATRDSFFDGASGETSSTGGGGSHTHSIEPPYYSLIFIMKT